MLRADLPPPRLLGEAGVLPLRSPCPAGCAFCYEAHLPSLVPNVQLLKLPAYSPEAFAAFADALSSSSRPFTPVSPIFVHEGILHYASMSDIFCQGFSLEQLERLIQQNIGRKRCELSTSGNHLDPEMARYLTTRYPETFRLRYSVMTLSADLRSTLHARSVGSAVVLETLSVLRGAECVPVPLRSAADDRRPSGRQHPPSAWRPRPDCPPALHADAWRADPRTGSTKRARLWRGRCVGDAQPLGARSHRGDRFPGPRPKATPGRSGMPCETSSSRFDSLGGSTTFAQTISTENIFGVLTALRRERAISRVVLPSSIFWVAGRHAVDGRSIDDVRSRMPDVEIAVVPVPSDLTHGCLTPVECFNYSDRNPDAPDSGDFAETDRNEPPETGELS